MTSLLTDTGSSSSSSSSIYKVDGFEEITDGVSWEELSKCYTREKSIHGFEDSFSSWFCRHEATHFYNTKNNNEDFNEKVLNKVVGTQLKAETSGIDFSFNVKIASVELARDRQRVEKKELYERCLKQLQDAFEAGKPTHFSLKKKDIKNMDEEVQQCSNVTKYGTCPICLQDISPNNACIFIRRRNMGKQNVTLRQEFMEQACKCTFCNKCVKRHMDNERRKLRDDQVKGSIRSTQKLPECPCCKNKYFGAVYFKASVQKSGNQESTVLTPTVVVPYLYELNNYGMSLSNIHHESLHENGNYGHLFQQHFLYLLYFPQERALTLRKNMLNREEVQRTDVEEAFGLTHPRLQQGENDDDVADAIYDLRFGGNLYLDNPTHMYTFCRRMQAEFEAIYAEMQRVEQDWLHCNPFPYSFYAGDVYKILRRLKKAYNAVLEEERKHPRAFMESTVAVAEEGTSEWAESTWDNRARPFVSDGHEFNPIEFGDDDIPGYVPTDEGIALVRPRDNSNDANGRPRRRRRHNM